MLLSTTHTVEGKKIVQTLGLVKGNTIRARWFGRDIVAGLKHLVGGEITTYTEMMIKAREEAQSRMVEEAKNLGANAIVSIRFSTSMIMPNAAEILAYGTAVVVK